MPRQRRSNPALWQTWAPPPATWQTEAQLFPAPTQWAPAPAPNTDDRPTVIPPAVA